MYKNHKIQCFRCHAPVDLKEYERNHGACDECREVFEKGAVVKKGETICVNL